MWAWQVPHTSHGGTAALDIPWLRLGELEQIHMLHYGAELRDPVDSYHHPRSHRSEGRLCTNTPSTSSTYWPPTGGCLAQADSTWAHSWWCAKEWQILQLGMNHRCPLPMVESLGHAQCHVGCWHQPRQSGPVKPSFPA